MEENKPESNEEQTDVKPMDGESPEPPKEKAEPKAKNNKLLWLVLLVLLLLLLGAGAWWMLTSHKSSAPAPYSSSQSSSNTKKQTAQANTPAQATCNDTPGATMKENIKAALDSKNTAAFATYFSDPVTFVIAASEKGGSETPDQAAVDMEYANTATGPWDFSLPQTTLDHYDAGFYTDYFDANTYTGRAASGQVAAFDFDCNGKIKQAFLAVNEDLL